MTVYMLFAWMMALSVLSYLLFSSDKRSARRRGRRVSEKTLLMLALAGGWPGGFVAQKVLRHKNRKQDFLARFWIAAVINIAIIGWLVASGR